ncbi:MAG TPA: hypothetical protein VGR62_05820 [Candidatus Binatia bacterium]|nr:hypothetical protein [Candidatus Binatia bacterium]
MTRRTIAAGAMLLTMALVTGHPAHAGTQRENLERELSRFTTIDVSRPKTICVCQDGSKFDGGIGSLFQFRDAITELNGVLVSATAVVCSVLGFDVQDRPVETYNCLTFAVLSR